MTFFFDSLALCNHDIAKPDHGEATQFPRHPAISRKLGWRRVQLNAGQASQIPTTHLRGGQASQLEMRSSDNDFVMALWRSQYIRLQIIGDENSVSLRTFWRLELEVELGGRRRL